MPVVRRILTALKKQREGLTVTEGSGIAVLRHLETKTPPRSTPSLRSAQKGRALQGGAAGGRPPAAPSAAVPGSAAGWRPLLGPGLRRVPAAITCGGPGAVTAPPRPAPPPPQQRLSGGGGPRPGAGRRDGGGGGRGAAAGRQLPLPALPAPLDDRHRLRHDRAGLGNAFTLNHTL